MRSVNVAQETNLPVLMGLGRRTGIRRPMPGGSIFPIASGVGRMLGYHPTMIGVNDEGQQYIIPAGQWSTPMSGVGRTRQTEMQVRRVLANQGEIPSTLNVPTSDSASNLRRRGRLLPALLLGAAGFALGRRRGESLLTQEEQPIAPTTPYVEQPYYDSYGQQPYYPEQQPYYGQQPYYPEQPYQYASAQPYSPPMVYSQPTGFIEQPGTSAEPFVSSSESPFFDENELLTALQDAGYEDAGYIEEPDLSVETDTMPRSPSIQSDESAGFNDDELLAALIQAGYPVEGPG